jgi:ferric-dicitrate binding protein FerR (iron transport regulator)
MKAFRFIVPIVLTFSFSVLRAQSNPDSILQMEASGDTAGARAALARAAESQPNNIPAWTRYAEFLERYGDPGAREAYGKLLTLETASRNQQRAALIARRLAVLDLLAGDRNATSRHLDAYRSAAGKALTVAWPPSPRIRAPMKSYQRSRGTS